MKKSNYLYIISSNENGPVKIGISYDTDKRIKQLQTGHSEKLKLFYTYMNDPEIISTYEKILHKTLKHRKTIGEWFDISVDDAINEIEFVKIKYGDVEYLKETWKDLI